MSLNTPPNTSAKTTQPVTPPGEWLVSVHLLLQLIHPEPGDHVTGTEDKDY